MTATAVARAPDDGLALASAAGRWTIAASVIGSGAVFVEMTVVNVALPAIGRDLTLGVTGLQWVLDGYLLSLSALMLFGGSLGDVMSRRRVFGVGLLAFALTSLLCAFAPNLWTLVTLRLLQGVAGALAVPNSLAMLETLFREEDRGTAIGRWAGWSAVSTAAGPLIGGWLIDVAGWRWIFAAVAPIALVAGWIALRRLPEREPTERRGWDSVDVPGAVLATLGLSGVIAALISGPGAGFDDPLILAALAIGVLLLVAFFVVERRSELPMLPLDIFHSPQFTGANLVTLFVYAALGAVFFLLMVQLQGVLGYSALAAGASLLPINGLMLVLSPMAGRVGRRIGPRWPLTIGSLLAAVGVWMLGGIGRGADYVIEVLPAIVLFGLGLSSLVAPLTTAVLGAVADAQAGIASAVNNAVARLAGLLAVAIVPLAAGISALENIEGEAFSAGFTLAMRISAGLCAAGALIALLTTRSAGTADVRHRAESA